MTIKDAVVCRLTGDIPKAIRDRFEVKKFGDSWTCYDKLRGESIGFFSTKKDVYIEMVMEDCLKRHLWFNKHHLVNYDSETEWRKKHHIR